MRWKQKTFLANLYENNFTELLSLLKKTYFFQWIFEFLSSKLDFCSVFNTFQKIIKKIKKPKQTFTSLFPTEFQLRTNEKLKVSLYRDNIFYHSCLLNGKVVSDRRSTIRSTSYITESTCWNEHHHQRFRKELSQKCSSFRFSRRSTRKFPFPSTNKMCATFESERIEKMKHSFGAVSKNFSKFFFRFADFLWNWVGWIFWLRESEKGIK